MQYVRTTLRPDGGAPVELLVTSDLIGYRAPIGARRVPGLSSDSGLDAWWWEAGGVGHLDWTVDAPGFMSSRSLQGKGLTLPRALALGRSLEPVTFTDPRLRPFMVGRSAETAPTTSHSG